MSENLWFVDAHKARKPILDSLRISHCCSCWFPAVFRTCLCVVFLLVADGFLIVFMCFSSGFLLVVLCFSNNFPTSTVSRKLSSGILIVFLWLAQHRRAGKPAHKNSTTSWPQTTATRACIHGFYTAWAPETQLRSALASSIHGLSTASAPGKQQQPEIAPMDSTQLQRRGNSSNPN